MRIKLCAHARMRAVESKFFQAQIQEQINEVVYKY
jgi:hypothetical protein